ncbi:phospholipid scramblase 1-like [Haemaphysalis longicornis]
MDMYDHKGTSVIHLTRPLRCVQCWCFCCLQELTVQAPPGTNIAYVYQNCSICYPTFTIYDRNYKPALTIVGPMCTQSMPCSCDVKFEVRSMNGVVIGAITKKWSGLIKEYFTDADNFGVSFPKDLDVNLKASLLATTMLIDYMFFEETYKQSDDRGPGMMG